MAHVVEKCYSVLNRWLYISLVLLSGCVAYGDIDNQKLTGSAERPGYSIIQSLSRPASSDTLVLLTFSGGGTRAAALSYGVLKGLRDSPVPSSDSSARSLLDDVRGISAVSGGSFTAAWYGLHGKDTFDNFETEFLRRDFSGAIYRGVFNPLRWFSRRGRTDLTVDYFDDRLFHQATFADLDQKDGPLIIINATDLGSGVRFSFLQEYFDLLCSDLSEFSLAKAVTASSAVPVMFHPVMLERHTDCEVRANKLMPENALLLNSSIDEDRELDLVVEKLVGFEQPRAQPSFVHLVDGGITDNLGLRAMYDLLATAGGAEAFLEHYNKQPPRRMVVISVNAAIVQPADMNQSNRRPDIEQTVMAVSAIQMERYNAATMNLVANALSRWTDEFSTPEHPVEFYFIPIGFDGITDEKLRKELSSISTSYSLPDSQVDSLIATGASLLTNHEKFQNLMRSLQESDSIPSE